MPCTVRRGCDSENWQPRPGVARVSAASCFPAASWRVAGGGAGGRTGSMSDATRMLLTTPAHHGLDTAVLGETIDALTSCSQTSASCADACLDEYNLRRE